MARLETLKIHGLRNIARAELEGFSRFNVFSGDNGAGKTSVLEAVHIIGLGRSFRMNRHRPLIQHDASAAVVYGEVKSAQGALSSVGVRRARSREHMIKLDGRRLSTTSELASLLPLQVINSETFQLILGPPGLRRQFLDWGVFHVEQDFLAQWRRLQRSLKQRNSLLRHGKMRREEVAPWDAEFLQAGESVAKMRERYFSLWLPVMDAVLGRLWPEGVGEVNFALYPGWAASESLLDIMNKQYVKDRELGYTTMGPHRAELKISCHGAPAGDVLSRGQLKLVSAAMRLSQAVLLQAGEEAKSCVVLVDDLPSELDDERRGLLCRELAALGGQIFITSVDGGLAASGFGSHELTMFHVEHGFITNQGQSG